MRILVAGVGNVLRGDDAFGIEVLRRLQEAPAMQGVRFFESGIAGISLVQELMDDYDALLIIDALDRGAEPGRLFVLQPDEESLARGASHRESTDLHQADPEAVLRMARAIKVLPERVWIIGCQAVGCDDLGAPLSEPVARAVPLAVRKVQEIVEALAREEVCHAGT
ncbi:MAG TPA: hydrogenase maturation protease [Chthoniobacterales bacterium]|nr:hydrogenase maturation protease [Chthoniobacterales bacterium]